MWASALQHVDLKSLCVCVWAYRTSFLFATVELNILHLLINTDKHHLPVNIIDSFTRLFRFRLYLLGLLFIFHYLFTSIGPIRRGNEQADGYCPDSFICEGSYLSLLSHSCAAKSHPPCHEKFITENTPEHSLSAALSKGKKNHKWDLVNILIVYRVLRLNGERIKIFPKALASQTFLRKACFRHRIKTGNSPSELRDVNLELWDEVQGINRIVRNKVTIAKKKTSICEI